MELLLNEILIGFKLQWKIVSEMGTQWRILFCDFYFVLWSAYYREMEISNGAAVVHLDFILTQTQTQTKFIQHE